MVLCDELEARLKERAAAQGGLQITSSHLSSRPARQQVRHRQRFPYATHVNDIKRGLLSDGCPAFTCDR